MTIELSPRQREVLLHASRGLDSAATAGKLFIAESTCRLHRQAAMHRLGAKNMAHAVAMGVSAGIIPAVPLPKGKR